MTASATDFLAQHAEAFDRLYRRYSRTVPASLREDLRQAGLEGILIAVAAGDEAHAMERARTAMRRLARVEARFAAREMPPDGAEGPEDPAPDPEQECVRCGDRNTLEHLAASLPCRELRHLAWARFVEDPPATRKALAAEMGCTIRQLRTLEQRARKLMSAHLVESQLPLDEES